MKRKEPEWLSGPGVVAWLDQRGLRTLAERKSDRARMALRRWGEGSAANYVQRILTKLGFRSRAQIAVWAAQHGLDDRPESDRA